MAPDPSELNPKCESCIFWQRKSDEIGECRFRAPMVYSVEPGALARWPLTNESDWCGDWAKPAEPEPWAR